MNKKSVKILKVHKNQTHDGNKKLFAESPLIGQGKFSNITKNLKSPIGGADVPKSKERHTNNEMNSSKLFIAAGVFVCQQERL